MDADEVALLLVEKGQVRAGRGRSAHRGRPKVRRRRQRLRREHPQDGSQPVRGGYDLEQPAHPRRARARRRLHPGGRRCWRASASSAPCASAGRSSTSRMPASSGSWRSSRRARPRASPARMVADQRDEERLTAEALAGELAEANAQLLGRQKVLELLQELTKVASSSLSLAEIGGRVLELVHQRLDLAAGLIYTVEPSAGELRALALIGYPDDAVRGMQVMPVDEDSTIGVVVRRASRWSRTSLARSPPAPEKRLRDARRHRGRALGRAPREEGAREPRRARPHLPRRAVRSAKTSSRSTAASPSSQRGVRECPGCTAEDAARLEPGQRRRGAGSAVTCTTRSPRPCSRRR